MPAEFAIDQRKVPVHSNQQQPPYQVRRLKMNRIADARIATLETDMKFVRRDLDEVRTDVRDIRERVASVESKLGILTERVDSTSEGVSEKLAGMSDKLDRFPTKLQLSLWACAGLTALLGVTASMIAVLLRLAGMHDAAAVVDAVSGK